jgi:hypothetical protein
MLAELLFMLPMSLGCSLPHGASAIQNIRCRHNVDIVVEPATIDNLPDPQDDSIRYEYVLLVKPKTILYLDVGLPVDRVFQKPFRMNCSDLGDWRLSGGTILTIGVSCHLVDKATGR